MTQCDPHNRDVAESLFDAVRRGGRQREAAPIDTSHPNRRAFLFGTIATAAGLLAGCSTGTRTTQLPEPTWRDGHALPDSGAPYPTGPTDSAVLPGGVLARSQWALGGPATSQMNPMRPVRYITVHHDGSEVFYAADAASSQARLESIRRGHRGRNWGDIGYHFAVDRAGRVYECRSVAWQGAHVKNHNEGNIGVVNLGNFDLQSPTEAQVAGLRSILRSLQQQYRVPVSRVRTHQEWAATACPGRTMQHSVNALRSGGQLA